MDGNRRWARRRRLDPSVGHRVGAEHIANLLRWSETWGVEHLSVYVLSADNIRKRNAAEVAHLFDLLATVVPDAVGRSHLWSLHLSGNLDLLPTAPRRALDEAAVATAGRPCHITMAIGYDARQDIVDGIRKALRAERVTGTAGNEFEADDITRHLVGGPVKDLDLVIRTGGDRAHLWLLSMAGRKRRHLLRTVTLAVLPRS